MRFFIYLLPLLVLASASAYGQSQIDCLNHLNLPSTACAQYRHDPITVFFRDQNTLEQEVTVHRIRDNTGRVVHVDLDLKLQCVNDCSAGVQQAVSNGLWELRAAYSRNGFYTKRWVSDCGEGDFCHDSKSIEDPQLSATDKHLQPDEGNVTSQRNRGRPVEDWIPIIDSALNLKDRLFKDSRNEQELREQFVIEQKAPSKFIIQPRNGAYIVCAITNAETGDCAPIKGRLNVSDNSGFADFQHPLGQDFNDDLGRWTRDWFFNRPMPLSCSQSSRCDFNGNCTITLTCR